MVEIGLNDSNFDKNIYDAYIKTNFGKEIAFSNCYEMKLSNF